MTIDDGTLVITKRYVCAFDRTGLDLKYFAAGKIMLVIDSHYERHAGLLLMFVDGQFYDVSVKHVSADELFNVISI